MPDQCISTPSIFMRILAEVRSFFLVITPFHEFHHGAAFSALHCEVNVAFIICHETGGTTAGRPFVLIAHLPTKRTVGIELGYLRFGRPVVASNGLEKQNVAELVEVKSRLLDKCFPQHLPSRRIFNCTRIAGHDDVVIFIYCDGTRKVPAESSAIERAM